uniref:Uncharacterized protein n=1 Tax=viral metagenome TaxID=1070528 RepID=A0A6M3KJ30_9ZZZZ
MNKEKFLKLLFGKNILNIKKQSKEIKKVNERVDKLIATVNGDLNWFLECKKKEK